MTGIRRIEVVRINEQVYEAIEEAIVHCGLSPGAVLGDRQLADTLGVSRTPVMAKEAPESCTWCYVGKGKACTSESPSGKGPPGRGAGSSDRPL